MQTILITSIYKLLQYIFISRLSTLQEKIDDGSKPMANVDLFQKCSGSNTTVYERKSISWNYFFYFCVRIYSTTCTMKPDVYDHPKWDQAEKQTYNVGYYTETGCK